MIPCTDSCQWQRDGLCTLDTPAARPGPAQCRSSLCPLPAYFAWARRRSASEMFRTGSSSREERSRRSTA